MIGSKKQCRYCSNFRYREMVVIDVATGCQNTYDGECKREFAPAPMILVNLSDDCPFFIKKGGIM